MTLRVCMAAGCLAGCAAPSGADIRFAEDCPQRPTSNIAFWFDAPAVEPGGAVTLSPFYTERPGLAEPLPPACITGASVSPPGQASLDRLDDGRLTVRVAETAEPGRVIVEARYFRADRPISAIIDVYDGQAAPLTGVWRQSAAVCAQQGAEPIRELIFEGDGDFSVTWTPFERYKDYWGRYTFDPDAGVLTLEPESGNQIPGDISDGAAELSADGRSLTLQTASFGTPDQGRRCTAPFTRTG